MTKVINKEDNNTNLYFTLDRIIEGDCKLKVVSNYTNHDVVIDLPAPTITNERYTLFILNTSIFEDLNSGLYSYYLTDEGGDLEYGTIKIVGVEDGDNIMIEVDEDGDDFITVED